jgi:L-ascorbate metabolism protein UlaG (beta-lactamase superfamily)
MACGKCSESCPAQIDIMESLRIYKDYLGGNTKILKKIDEMQSAGKPADLILVTHSHFDHSQTDKVEKQNEGCQIITYKEAVQDGIHRTFELGFVTVEAVEAGYNSLHDVNDCVGYVLTFSNGKSVYVTGDTSKTEQMSLMDEMEIDYAFFCCDGVYNMGLEEAAECADLVGAKHNIPYHMTTNTTGRQFDRELAEQFDVENRLIVEDGEEIVLE